MQLKKNSTSQRHLKKYIRSRTFQRIFIGLVTIAIAFFIVENGAEPVKYKITLGEKSLYDIEAPRDVENKLKTKQLAEQAADAVRPIMIKLDNVPLDVLNKTDDFMSGIEDARKSITKSLQDQGITRKDKNYKQKLELEQAIAEKSLTSKIEAMGIPLTEAQIKYLVTKVSDEELEVFKKLTRQYISSIMKEEITQANLNSRIYTVQSQYQNTLLSQEFKNIGSMLVKSILERNSVEDTELTEKKKQEAYDQAAEAKQIIPEGTRIISYGDTVTEDKLEVLKELNLVETGKFNYTFALGILGILLMLAGMLLIYMKFFCKKILYDRSNMILVSVIIILTLVMARVVNIYSSLLIPIFMAPLLISILLDIRLAMVVNFVLSIAVSFFVRNDSGFLVMALISGTIAAFIISRANQRSKMSAAGLLIGLVNAAIIICVGLLNKNGLSTIAYNSATVLVNGLISTIFTIGLLPFLESVFNIITPLKLLELANPNQPLIKRLLMEAPGTYHHSLMVGNLAEVATEAINGNSLLARVGAYYHDIGKLKRPNFFKENQLSDNPHDRMTANLSTLVIISHTQDGLEIAEKYKVPMAIKDIISQHHGNTLVAYFYHKAGKSEKAEGIKPEDYRYPGPRPTSKEAAVVMLADSVEAAVRSMVDKTEGKIEGLVRKIIKDKLDDGQLNQCELTLKDLDDIAKAFMRVFSGYFHEREEYPEVKVKKSISGDRMPAAGTGEEAETEKALEKGLDNNSEGNQEKNSEKNTEKDSDKSSNDGKESGELREGNENESF